MQDYTVTPTEAGAYVDRVVRLGHEVEYIHTVKVGQGVAQLAKATGIPADEVRRWWFETHNERLIVVR